MASNQARDTDRQTERSGSLWITVLALGLLVGGYNPRYAAVGSRSGVEAARRQAGHGRHAASPEEIPARGWKDVALRVYRNITKHRVLAIAAGVTFYSLLAVFPAVAALVSIYGLFADVGSISAHLDKLASVLPGGAIAVIHDQITRVASQGHGTLGATFAIGLLGALWSSNAGVKAMFDALNVIYGEEEKRGFIKLNAMSLAVTTGAICFLLLAMGAVVVLPILLKMLWLPGGTELVIRVASWPLLFAALTVGLAVLYRYGPSRDRPQWRWCTWGSMFAALGWLVASMAFSFYAANFGTFNETYGSLGAVIGFMIWIWISAIVVLIGAELNAEMEHQTAHDTTEGHPTPMGTRNARVADTLGSASD